MIDILGSIDEKIEHYVSEKRKIVELGKRLYDSLKTCSDESKSFGDLFEFQNGFAFKSKDYLPSEKYKVITIKNITEQGFSADNTETISYKNEYKDFILDCGDILLTMTGEVGRCGIVDLTNCLLNQRVLKVKGESPFFTYFTLVLYSEEIKALAKGSVQLNLGLKDLSKLRIPIAQMELYKKFDCLIDKLIQLSIEQRKTNELKQLFLKKFFN